jgi:heterotetrameric sarcosine oxidase beta subunit
VPGKVIVCLCHDVTEEDVRRAVAEGYDDLETVKRYTGAMMGSCQGKTCACAVRDLVARLTRRAAGDLAPPARRPPAFPARLGNLGGADRGAPPAAGEAAGRAEGAALGTSPRSAAARVGRREAPRHSVPGTTTAELRKAYDVIVIGAGIQGLALAYELAKRGAGRVAVLDRGYPGCGASGRNGEMIRSAFASPEWIRFFDESLRRWRSLSSELEFNVLFTPSGYLILASTAEHAAALPGQVERQQRHGLHAELLSAAEVRELCPQLSPDLVAGGILQRDGGFAHHDACVWAYAQAAGRLGVEVHPYTTVTGLFVTAGRVRGVSALKASAARGSAVTIAAPLVVDAAGGHAADIAAMAGVDLPVKTFRLEMMATESLAPFLRVAVSAPAIMGYCHQTTRGEFVGGTEPGATQPSLSLRSTVSAVRHVADRFARLFPSLAGVRMLRQWAGLVTETADVAPVLGPVPEVAGFVLDCGWVYGFMGAPGAGALLAEQIVSGRTPEVLAPFGIERLRTGHLIPETSLVVSAEARG